MGSLLPSGYILDGKFELLNEIGSGGLATVYKARQVDLGRIVAIKIIHSSFLDDTEFQTRFLREAQALCQLSHPNIVTIYQMGITPDNLPYMAMELVEGKSIANFLGQNTRLGTIKSLKIAKALANALAYVHEKGIVHRDLKPSNMILSHDENGESVKLIDFGLARFVETKTQSMTGTGELLGTPEYMSPEQCLGKKVDYKSDIYSLCTSLYEMLSGERAFSADNSIGLLYKHINEPVPSLDRSKVDHYDSILDEILCKGMEKNPDSRFSSMNELASELERAIQFCENASQSSAARPRVVCDFRIASVSGAFVVLLCCVLIFVSNGGKNERRNESKKMSSANLSVERLLLASKAFDDLERAIQFQEAYSLSLNKKVSKSLKLQAIVSYGMSLIHDVNLPSQGLLVLEKLPLPIDAEGNFSDVVYAKLLTFKRFGEYGKARKLLSDFIETARLSKLSPFELVELAVQIDAPNSIDKLVDRSSENIKRLVDISNVLRLTGRIGKANETLQKAELLSAFWFEEAMIANEKVFLLLAAGKYKQALEYAIQSKAQVRVSRESQKMNSALINMNDSLSWESVQTNFPKVKRFAELLSNTNCNFGNVDSPELPKLFEELRFLERTPETANELVTLVRESKETKMSRLHRIQFINLDLSLNWDPYIEPSLDQYILLATIYRLMQDETEALPLTTRINCLCKQAKMFAFLGDYGKAEAYFKEAFQIAGNDSHHGDDPFYSFDYSELIFNKISYANLLRLQGRKDFASALGDFDVAKINNDGVLIRLLRFLLDYGNLSDTRRLVEECSNINVLFDMVPWLIDSHKLDLARRCVERIKTKLSPVGEVHRFLQDARICVLQCSIELEDANTAKALEIYRAYCQARHVDPTPQERPQDRDYLYQRLSIIGGVLGEDEACKKFRKSYFAVRPPKNKEFQ